MVSQALRWFTWARAEAERIAQKKAGFQQATAAELAGEASQVDKWLDSINMGMCKKEVRDAKVFKLIDLANMDSVELRNAFPKMDPKVRNKLAAKLEEAEIPDD